MILFIDCSNGVSGDMLVAALLELTATEHGGEPLDDVVRPALAALGLAPDLVASEMVRRGGVAARAFTVADAPGFDTFAELVAAVNAAALPPAVAAAAVGVAGRMAAAEERVHGGEDVHLHELSGIDTVVDLVSTAALLHRLSPDAVKASPPALGGGSVQTAHGLVAVPAPAVLDLLRGWPTAGAVAGGEGSLGELTTPTGAALVTHFATPSPGLPGGRIGHVGFGAGQREVPGRPNVLRAVLLGSDVEGDADPEPRRSGGEAAHVLLETNVDDMTPELLAHAAETLRGAGGLDVWLTQALMKKGRPGSVLHVLARAADRDRLAELVFAETSSFGLRVLPVARLYAEERHERVSVGGCEIAVRVAIAGGRPATVSPEYEDVRRAAAVLGRPAKAVYEEAQAAARERFGEPGVLPR
jgi:pyridinium-3,5-bisthiocarboxylic acid mononucleotide nickel chelatase